MASFYYGDAQRLAYMWDNPNDAGAVLCTLIPMAWALLYWPRRKRHLAAIAVVVPLVIEFTLFIALLLTYSRGAFVALIVSYAWFVTWMRKRQKGVPQEGWPIVHIVTIRVGIYLSCIIASGLFGRFASILGGDRSALNRIPLWIGGLQLLATSPLEGWGKGFSGIAYMQWFQDPMASTVHRGMTNSFLDVAVEFGAGGIMLYMFSITSALVYVILLTSSITGYKQVLLLSASATIVAYTIAGCFSTFWYLPGVSGPVVASVVACVVCAKGVAGPRIVKRSLVVGFWCSALCTLITLVVGLVFRISAPFTITRITNDTVIVRSTTVTAPACPLTLVIDEQCLGSLYGPNLRLAMQGISKRIGQIVVYAHADTPRVSLWNHVIVFGSRVSDVDLSLFKSTTWLVCPRRPPPSYPDGEQFSQIHILLPISDELDMGPEWRMWARKHGASVQTVNVGRELSTLQIRELLTYACK